MRNLSIQGLRGYLMIWIVLFHYTTRYPILYPSANMEMPIRFENGGEVGIVIFFAMSGFFLAKGLLGLDSSNKKLLEFCMHKYLRLWFPYVVSTILIFICIKPPPLLHSMSYMAIPHNCYDTHYRAAIL